MINFEFLQRVYDHITNNPDKHHTRYSVSEALGASSTKCWNHLEFLATTSPPLVVKYKWRPSGHKGRNFACFRVARDTSDLRDAYISHLNGEIYHLKNEIVKINTTAERVIQQLASRVKHAEEKLDAAEEEIKILRVKANG